MKEIEIGLQENFVVRNVILCSIKEKIIITLRGGFA